MLVPAAMAAGAALIIGFFGFVGRRQAGKIVLEEPTIHISGSVGQPLTLRILYFSDTHLDKGTPTPGRLLELIAELDYDLCLIGGDLANDETGRHRAVDIARHIHAPLGCYAVPGNHDRFRYGVIDTLRKLFRGQLRGHAHLGKLVPLGDFPARLATAGVRMLFNESLRLDLAGEEVWLVGVDDEHSGYNDLGEALRDVPVGACPIVFTHSPDLFPGAVAAGVPLVIAGHTHGGQIVFPLIGAPQTKSKLRLKRPAGLFRAGASQLYISRGVGSTIPLRFSAPPEVSLITLHISPD